MDYISSQREYTLIHTGSRSLNPPAQISVLSACLPGSHFPIHLSRYMKSIFSLYKNFRRRFEILEANKTTEEIATMEYHQDSFSIVVETFLRVWRTMWIASTATNWRLKNMLLFQIEYQDGERRRIDMIVVRHRHFKWSLAYGRSSAFLYGANIVTFIYWCAWKDTGQLLYDNAIQHYFICGY